MILYGLESGGTSYKQSKHKPLRVLVTVSFVLFDHLFPNFEFKYKHFELNFPNAE